MTSELSAEGHLLVKQGDLVYNMMRMWQGAVGVALEDGIVSPAYVVCAPKDGIDSLYIYFLIKTAHSLKKLTDYSHGITSDRLRLYFQDFSKIPIAIHSPPTQKKLALLFDICNKEIKLIEYLIAANQKRRNWLMQQLLTSKKRLPGFAGTWEEVRLSELFKPVRRKNDKSSTHVLTASGEHGLVDQAEYFNRNVSGVSLEGYYLLQRGEFAYNRSSMNGYPYGAIKRLDEYDEGVLSTLYICFKPNSHACHSDYYKHIFEGGILNRQLRKVVQVGARAHGLLNVTLHDFFSLKVPCPSLDEQHKIASTIDVADREIDILSSQLKSLREQKRGFMQQLLSDKGLAKN